MPRHKTKTSFKKGHITWCKGMHGIREGKNNPNWKGGRITMKCVICNCDFSIRPGLVDKQKCCSRKCRNEYIKSKYGVEVKCKYCGKEFHTNRYRVNRGEGIFCSKRCRGKYESDTNWIIKMRKSNTIKPTKPERIMIDILSNSEFNYVGDGKVWIADLNPDFIDVNNKKIIEVFGDYWHNDSDELNKRNVYSDYGYNMIVIWEHELYDNIAYVIRKIKNFVEGD